MDETDVKGCPFAGLQGHPCFPPLCRLASDGKCAILRIAEAAEETRDILKEMRNEG